MRIKKLDFFFAMVLLQILFDTHTVDLIVRVCAIKARPILQFDSPEKLSLLTTWLIKTVLRRNSQGSIGPHM